VDAIAQLKADHRKVEKLFKEFERAGDRAHAAKARAVEAMVRELSVHAAVEELVFYPALLEEMPEARSYLLDSYEEHHVVKWLCDELDKLSPDDERFDPKARVLIGAVRYHVAEEETALFPAVRAAVGRKQLTVLGDLMDEARRTAPTRPHPRLTDPPGSTVAGLVAGAVDRARDAGKKVVDEARNLAS
jgi:hemerythrin superfamily protein